MKLKYALKSIVEEEGREILKETRVVNILSDYKSFDEVPASKVILKMLIDDGYMNQLLDSDDLASKSESLRNYFISALGFQADCVYFVFNSVSYALGLCESQNDDADEADNISNIETKRRSLEDIVEIDINSTIDKGIDISNLFIEYSGKKCIHLTFEVFKANDYSVTTYVVIFDKKGRVRKKEAIETIWSDEHHRFMTTYCDLPVPRTNISKILITAY